MKNTMDILGKLFGDNGRVKILRLFLLNPDLVFSNKDVSKRSGVGEAITEKEVVLLEKIDFLEKKEIITDKKESGKKEKNFGWQLNPDFSYLKELEDLLFSVEFLTKEDLVKKIRSTGRIKLIIVSGIFINNNESRADLLIVGDGINKKVLDKTLKKMELEIGKELYYGIFDSDDFKYRISVYDKFIRDVLDFPHKIIFDKRGE